MLAKDSQTVNHKRKCKHGFFKDKGNLKKLKIMDDTTSIRIEIADEGVHFINAPAFYYTANVLYKGQSYPLDGFSHELYLDIPATKNYEVVFIHNHLRTKKITKLSAEMSKNLIKFLSGGRVKNECCYDFINDMYFGCSIQDQRIFRHTMRINENTLTIGQAISIGEYQDDHYNPTHAAIYIGHNLFISMMGVDKPLYVMNLKQMRIAYNSKNESVVIPIAECDYISDSTSWVSPG